MIYDYLIIGAGLSGLNTARLIPKDKSVLIVCKKEPWQCNTFFAQGGVSVAVDKDDIQNHINDTLKAGVYLNSKNAVNKLCEHSIEVIDELIHSGMKFDRNKDGKLSYTNEAAHSKSRVIHADGDATGRELHLFLLQNCHHNILTKAIVLDILYQENICYGATILHNNKTKTIYAHNTIVSSGGIGAIYKFHTNSTTISGDIHGIMVEKGIKLKDMEMLQFHPTVYVDSSTAQKQLLSEALRGEGAKVVDENGYAFLKDYHKNGELAPRDVVSRAIFDYISKTKSKIYLSFDDFSKKDFKKRFPNIYYNLLNLGFDLPRDKVPISPAFHYSMGGIEVDMDSLVTNSKNLFAVGEAASTGVHGANRLASNSLLEGLVFSKLAVELSLKNNFKIDLNKITTTNKHFDIQKPNDKKIKNSLRTLMWTDVGIVRKKDKLKDALDIVNGYLTLDIGRLLKLRLLTAKEIIKSAIKREKSIGAHFIKKENYD